MQHLGWYDLKIYSSTSSNGPAMHKKNPTDSVLCLPALFRCQADQCVVFIGTFIGVHRGHTLGARAEGLTLKAVTRCRRCRLFPD